MSSAEVFVPKYCFHKARGLAYVRLPDEGVIYLGRYDSPESHAKYKQVVAAWMARSNGLAMPTVPVASSTQLSPATSAATDAYPYLVKKFIRDFLMYAKTRYVLHRDFDHFKTALRPMLKMFGEMPLMEFGPKRLRQVRDEIIKLGLCRREVNRRIKRIRKAINWAVTEELCPGEVAYRLMALEPLRRGEAPVKESKPVRPVDPEIVKKTLPFLHDEVRTIVELMMLTGARSGEILKMRSRDIDMSQGDVWLYKPESHKTAWRGAERIIPLGPRAQARIKPFLSTKLNEFLFSPDRSEQKRRAVVHAERKTPESCGNKPGSCVKDDPQRKPGKRYTTTSLQRAISRATELAFPLPPELAKRVITPTSGRKRKPRLETIAEWRTRLTPDEKAAVKAWRKKFHWHPHQLRHTVGTQVRHEFGLEGSQAMLGHESIQATQIYAEARFERAIEIARKIG